jgi:hypothetical protein
LFAEPVAARKGTHKEMGSDIKNQEENVPSSTKAETD